jgi:hypothetical protein
MLKPKKLEIFAKKIISVFVSLKDKIKLGIQLNKYYIETKRT